MKLPPSFLLAFCILHSAFCISTWAFARDDVSHCWACEWEADGSLDLNPLVAPEGMPADIRAGIHFHESDDGEAPLTAANMVNGGVFQFGSCPKCLFPTIRMLTMCYGQQHMRLDDMWLVIYSPDTKTRFETWCSNNVSTAWAATLPKPFDIRTPIAAGTADFRRPYAIFLWSTGTLPNGYAHRDADVLPFIMALQMDGNPVVPVDMWRNLNRQCLRKGENTDAYIARRPILPSGVQPLEP